MLRMNVAVPQWGARLMKRLRDSGFPVARIAEITGYAPSTVDTILAYERTLSAESGAHSDAEAEERRRSAVDLRREVSATRR